MGSLTPVKMSSWGYLKPRAQMSKNTKNFWDVDPRRQCCWVVSPHRGPMTYDGGLSFVWTIAFISSAFWTGDRVGVTGAETLILIF